MNKISFIGRKVKVQFSQRKISIKEVSRKNCTQQVSRTKIRNQQVPLNKISFTREKAFSLREISTCNKFHERKSGRNSLHEQESTRNRFHEPNQFQEEKNPCPISKGKIKMQKHSWTKISLQQVPRTNQQARISIHKIRFTKRKINVHVSQRENATCNKINQQKQFHEEKSNHPSFTKRKINMQQASQPKSARIKFHEQKSTCNKFHEQNPFHEDKNQYTSLTKSITNIQ